MTDRLTPDTHMLHSKRARNWTLAGALEELVDNAIDHGQAGSVVIQVDNQNGIMVIDDGIGIDDINRIFTFGDSSAYDNHKVSGQYGIGATDATVFLGDLVKVDTVRDGRFHTMTVDWADVEKSGDWPTRYKKEGRATSKPSGSTIGIGNLSKFYHSSTIEGLAREFGRIFAPALRSGIKIEVQHWMSTSDQASVFEAVPFNPPNMTDEILISGVVETAKGNLPWSGRAGLSETLTDRHNGVHISFGHRVIETTREAFGGKSAPTLYVEVALDNDAPWKYCLADHKDKVVKHRDALMASINEQLQPLLEMSSRQATSLALQSMTAPIEAVVTKALKGAGILHIDEEELPTPGGFPDGPPSGIPVDRPGRQEARDPKDDGAEAKPAAKPTGVSVQFLPAERMNGKLYNWDIAGKQLILTLEEEAHEGTIGWPPRAREQQVTYIICSYLAQAIATEFATNEGNLNKALTAKLNSQLRTWAENGDGTKIAPLLNREILSHVG